MIDTGTDEHVVGLTMDKGELLLAKQDLRGGKVEFDRHGPCGCTGVETKRVSNDFIEFSLEGFQSPFVMAPSFNSICCN